MDRSLHRIFSVAKNAFREAVRDRVLYNLVLFMLLIVVCAILLGDLTDGQEARTIVNIGLTAMLFFGTFIAIFVGVGLVSKEIEKRTVFGIFAKPVRRWEFLVGKYLGLCATLLVNVLAMGAGISLALIIASGGKFAGTIWGSVALIYLELTIITAVAITFSTFSTPSLSALLTFLIFIIGHLSSSLLELARGLGSELAKFVFGAIYYLLPNLAHFSFRTEAANGLVPSAAMLAGGVAYTVVYVSTLLIIASVVFSRRNFK